MWSLAETSRFSPAHLSTTFLCQTLHNSLLKLLGFTRCKRLFLTSRHFHMLFSLLWWLLSLYISQGELSYKAETNIPYTSFYMFKVITRRRNGNHLLAVTLWSDHSVIQADRGFISACASMRQKFPSCWWGWRGMRASEGSGARWVAPHMSGHSTESSQLSLQPQGSQLHFPPPATQDQWACLIFLHPDLT